MKASIFILLTNDIDDLKSHPVQRTSYWRDDVILLIAKWYSNLFAPLTIHERSKYAKILKQTSN